MRYFTYVYSRVQISPSWMTDGGPLKHWWVGYKTLLYISNADLLYIRNKALLSKSKMHCFKEETTLCFTTAVMFDMWNSALLFNIWNNAFHYISMFCFTYDNILLYVRNYSLNTWEAIPSLKNSPLFYISSYARLHINYFLYIRNCAFAQQMQHRLEILMSIRMYWHSNCATLQILDLYCY